MLFLGINSIKRSVESTSPLLNMPDFHAVCIESPSEDKKVAVEPQTLAALPSTNLETESEPRQRSYWQYSIDLFQKLLTVHKPAALPKENQQNLPEKPVQSGINDESEAERRSQQLKGLEAQAMQLIQSGESNKAAEVVQQIRAIDPTADELKKIAVLQGSPQ